MVTKRKPAGLVLTDDGALVPNARLEEALEIGDFEHDLAEAVLLAWADVQGFEGIEIPYPALVAAVYDPDTGLPSEAWQEFTDALGDSGNETLVILAMASCWRKHGKTLDEVYSGGVEDRASARLHRKPLRNRPGPRARAKGQGVG